MHFFFFINEKVFSLIRKLCITFPLHFVQASVSFVMWGESQYSLPSLQSDTKSIHTLYAECQKYVNMYTWLIDMDALKIILYSSKWRLTAAYSARKCRAGKKHVNSCFLAHTKSMSDKITFIIFFFYF